MDTTNLSLSFSLLLLLIPTLYLLRRLRLPHRLPPGSLGLPFFGETLQLISAYKTPNPEPFADSRVSKFGLVFKTHFFGEPTIFSADPELNRFILQNEGRLFESSYPGSISNLLGKHSLLLMKGSLHKRMHSLTVSFANSAIIREHLLADIDRLVRINLEQWDGRVLLLEEAKKITFELMVKQLMSFDPCEWSENLRMEYMLVMEGFFSIPIALFSATYRRAIQVNYCDELFKHEKNDFLKSNRTIWCDFHWEFKSVPFCHQMGTHDIRTKLLMQFIYSINNMRLKEFYEKACWYDKRPRDKRTKRSKKSIQR